MAIISEFYKRLRDLCEERNMTVNELVKYLNLSSGSPTAWKNGTIPRSATLSKLADYFGVSTDYLLTGLPANISECPSDNPWEEDLIEAFDQLDIDRQIEAVEHVQNMVAFSDDPVDRKEKAPTETSERAVSDDDIKFALFGGDGEITDAMYREVKEFAALIKLREDMKKAKE